MYEHGQGVARSDTKALRLYRLASDQGNARAAYYLGLHFKAGPGDDQDAAEALSWFRIAADRGYADAQNELGIAYETGRGVARDETQAVIWFARAAVEGGDAPRFAAQFLGARSPSAKAAAALRLLVVLGYASADDTAGLGQDRVQAAAAAFRQAEGLPPAEGIDDALLIALARKERQAGHPS